MLSAVRCKVDYLGTSTVQQGPVGCDLTVGGTL